MIPSKTIKKQEIIIGYKEKCAECLCNINPPIQQVMIGSFLTDEEDNKDVILHKYTKNTFYKSFLLRDFIFLKLTTHRFLNITNYLDR